MKYNLTVLDKGISRFTEHDLVVVYRERVRLEELDSAAQCLLRNWPVLDSRLNVLKTKLLRAEQRKVDSGFWQGRALDTYVDEVVKTCSQKDVIDTVDMSQVDRLFRIGFVRENLLRPRVVTIRALELLNGTIIRFRVQHPFGDASAMLKIANEYCALLGGTTPSQEHVYRHPIELKRGIGVASCEDEVVKGIAALHENTFASSWGGFINRAWRQRLRDVIHPSCQRVAKTLRLPQSQVDEWAHEANTCGLNVTEHDIVLAFIQQQSSLVSSCEQSFGIVMNIQRQLELESTFGNPWVVVPVQPRQFHDPDVHKEEMVPALLNRAAHIRQTISSARDPACLSRIIDQHYRAKDRPFYPRKYGTRKPQVLVTSWAKHPIHELTVRGTKPVLSHGSVNLQAVFRRLGFEVDDVLALWKDEKGYYIYGRLQESLWAAMIESLKTDEAT